MTDAALAVIYAYFFFFFQAEDGIRDLYVTGVQTCALPISYRGAGKPFRSAPDGPVGLSRPILRCRTGTEQIANYATFRRSEERRVGKECRSRWAAYDEKEKHYNNKLRDKSSVNVEKWKHFG